MGRKLFVANTYYQLILTIQLRYTLFSKDDTVMLFSDHSNNAKEVVDNINKAHIFSECYYIETKNIDHNSNRFQNLEDTLSMIFVHDNRFSKVLPNFNDCKFDELICFTFNIIIDGIYYYLCSYNEKLALSRLEEGILSYDAGNVFYKKRYFIANIRKLLKKTTILDNLHNFYCYYPELYSGDLNAISVPLIKNGFRTPSMLKSIFNPKMEYNYKYIFFTSVYDFEGGEPVGEFELVCKIADLVGKDNLLVKTHPRDRRTIYQDNGFNVDKNSSIPWEAIQLSGDFSDKVFMTVNSGSVLSGSTMSENPVRTYYMYKLCDISGNPPCQKNAEDIKRLLDNESMREILRTVHIAESLEDIL